MILNLLKTQLQRLTVYCIYFEITIKHHHKVLVESAELVTWFLHSLPTWSNTSSAFLHCQPWNVVKCVPFHLRQREDHGKSVAAARHEGREQWSAAGGRPPEAAERQVLLQSEGELPLRTLIIWQLWKVFIKDKHVFLDWCQFFRPSMKKSGRLVLHVVK